MRFETLGDEAAFQNSRVKIYPSETTDSLTLGFLFCWGFLFGWVFFPKRAETTCPTQQELVASPGLGKENTVPVEIQS